MRTLLVLGAVMLLLAVGIACRNGETEEQQEQPVKSENADIVTPAGTSNPSGPEVRIGAGVSKERSTPGNLGRPERQAPVGSLEQHRSTAQARSSTERETTKKSTSSSESTAGQTQVQKTPPGDAEGGKQDVGRVSDTVLDMIPENLQFTDGVLLQDIYARMDLDQFALGRVVKITWSR